MRVESTSLCFQSLNQVASRSPFLEATVLIGQRPNECGDLGRITSKTPDMPPIQIGTLAGTPQTSCGCNHHNG